MHFSAFEKWDNSFAGYKSHFGMPAYGTTLYNWQHNQFSKGRLGLDARIKNYRNEKNKCEKCMRRLLECYERKAR